MHCEIRETQLPDQTRDTICINFAGKIVRLEAHSSEWLFTLLGPTVRKYYLNVKILSKRQNSQTLRYLAGYSEGICGTFSPLQTSRLPVQIDQSRAERKLSESLYLSRIDITHYYFSTIFKFYCGIFRWSIWSAARLAFRELLWHIRSLNAMIRKITRFIRIAFLVFVYRSVWATDCDGPQKKPVTCKCGGRFPKKETSPFSIRFDAFSLAVTSMTVFTIDGEDVSVNFCHCRNKFVLSKKRVFILSIWFRIATSYIPLIVSLSFEIIQPRRKKMLNFAADVERWNKNQGGKSSLSSVFNIFI